jgi:hypothetical protein
MQKKFFAVAAFALAFAVAFSASAYDLGSTTLKRGSKGTAVSQLQTALNACNAAGLSTDGNFGRGTEAAVKAFQASKSLTADGKAGNMTKAALNSCTSTTTTTTTTTTGSVALCPNGMTLASNCSAMPAPTGSVALCPNGMTLASNCSAMPTGSTSGVSGGAGNIQSLITLGSPSSATVSEGDSKKPVLGIEIKADSGSDLKISNIAVQFQKFSGSGSTWISRYVGNVYVMQGSNVIGSIPASSLSQNGNLYTANIAVTGATVAANHNGDFYIAVDGNTTIDSADSGSYLQTNVTSIRYMDGTNAVLTYSPSVQPNQTFLVQKLSSNANVKLQVSEDATNPHNRTITANYTSTTQDVSLLKFNVTANASPMYFNEIDANASATGVSDLTQVASLFKLNMNGHTISTVNYTTVVGGTSATLRFGNTTSTTPYTATSLNGGASLIIPAGQTASFEILADAKPLATGSSASVFDAGDTVKVDLPSSLLSSWVVLDQTGNNISTSTVNRQGSASGYDQTFRIQGLSATLASSSTANAARDTAGKLTALDVNLNVSVTASGSDFFIPRTVTLGASAVDTNVVSATSGFIIAGLNNAYAYDASVTSGRVSGSVNIVSGATIDGASGRIKINSGSTAVLQVVASINNPSSALTAAPIGSATGLYLTATAIITLTNSQFGNVQGHEK